MVPTRSECLCRCLAAQLHFAIPRNYGIVAYCELEIIPFAKNVSIVAYCVLNIILFAISHSCAVCTKYKRHVDLLCLEI